jgi:glycosyltransferase involved in cell wall biosynthesis
MKIALLTDGIYPHVMGGMQKHSYYLAKYLARNKVFVDLYHCMPSETRQDELTEFTDQEREYINSISIPFPQSKYFPGHYLRASYLYSEKILGYLKDHLDVDFIYVQGFTGWALLNAKRQGLKTPPVSINLHGLEMFQDPPTFKVGLQQQMLRPAATKNLRMAEVVFSLGGKLTDIVKSVGVPDARIIEIPIGIEESWLNCHTPPSVQPRKFIFVGRHERRKGVEELGEAIKTLMPQYEFEFHFIGPIPETVQITSPRIKYWGLVKEPQKIRDVLSGCDVLVCPSYSEGMPTVILEAMATGLSVIATDVGAVTEVVSPESGWIIPPGNARQLQDAIVEAIHIPDDMLLHRKNVNQEIIRERFTWDVVVERTINEIDRIVGSVNSSL